MSKQNLKPILCRTGVLCALLFTGPAFAADPAMPTRTVNFADLNLQSPLGLGTLYRRISRAADEVCQVPRDTRQFKADAFLKACKSKAINGAIDSLSMPALSHLHRQKSGRAPLPVRVADGN